MDRSEAQKQQTGIAPPVLGILSIVFGILTGIVGLVFGIVGITKSNKVLAEDPTDIRARNGKICSTLGIAISCVQMVAALIVSIVFGIGYGHFVEDQGAATRAATQTLEQTTNPSGEERAVLAAAIDKSFTSSIGIPLSSLGVSTDELTGWLFKDATSKITNVSVETNGSGDAAVTQAIVIATVSSHNFNDLTCMIEDKLKAPSAFTQGSSATMDQRLLEIGTIIKQAMNETALRERETSFTMTKRDGKWRVDDAEAQALAYDMYMGRQ